MKKTIISFVLIISILFSFIIPTYAEYVPIAGDVNLDGTISAADARLALRISAKLDLITGQAYTNADVDYDGKVKASDARKILRYAAQLESPGCVSGTHVMTTTNIPPTCYEEGYSIKKCKFCDYTEGERFNIIPKREHEVVKTYIQPTCVLKGYTTDKCIYCDYSSGYVYSPSEPPKGHNYKIISEIKGTCTTKGYITAECKDCGYKLENYCSGVTEHSVKELSRETLSLSKYQNIIRIYCECTVCKIKFTTYEYPKYPGIYIKSETRPFSYTSTIFPASEDDIRLIKVRTGADTVIGTDVTGKIRVAYDINSIAVANSEKTYSKDVLGNVIAGWDINGNTYDICGNPTTAYCFKCGRIVNYADKEGTCDKSCGLSFS